MSSNKPFKNELRKVSKAILKKVNKNLVDFLKVDQWKDTNNVTNWFNAILYKSQCYFIQLDKAEFYSSITESILHNSNKFCKATRRYTRRKF